MKNVFLFLTAVLIPVGVFAGPSEPFNMSIAPDIAIYGRTTTIEGVTLSIWGENPQTSLALGIVNGCTGDSAGLNAGLLVNYADHYKGVQWAPVNYTQHDSVGWDNGFINYTEKMMSGLLTGVVNVSAQLKGVQFGFINYVDTTDDGVQIGIINIIRSNRDWFGDLSSGLAPVMIFVNWGM